MQQITQSRWARHPVANATNSRNKPMPQRTVTNTASSRNMWPLYIATNGCNMQPQTLLIMVFIVTH
ncbi:hypothetical protein HMPREF3190_00097 [Umbribacter vaginalis]|nr:hypothetical protein HMPREF3190_00097 [Coriobacteriales bacterium DNF00809]